MFRFSIRDVLWLIVLVGVLTAWGVDRSRVAKQRDEATERWQEASEKWLQATQMGSGPFPASGGFQ